MAAGVGNAPTYRRLQRRANLSQLPSLLKWPYRRDLHLQPHDYQSSALLLSYGRFEMMAEGTGLEPAHPLKDRLFSRQLPLDLLFSA